MTFTVFTYVTTVIFVMIVMLVMYKLVDKPYCKVCSPGLILIILIAPYIRLLFPLEFPFSVIIRSSYVYPLIVRYFKAMALEFCHIRISRFDLLLLVWFVGAVVSITRGITRYFKLVQCFKYMKPTEDSQILSILSSELVKLNSSKKDFRIIKISCIHEPVIYGLKHPTILLPKVDFSDDELRHILGHELCHYSKGHMKMKWVLEIICAIHWWFPPAFWLKRKIYNLMEVHADRTLLKNKTDREKTNYLCTLHKICALKQGDNGLTPLFTLNYSYGDCQAMLKRFWEVKNLNNYNSAPKFAGVILGLVMFLLIASSYCIVLQPYGGAPPESSSSIVVLNEEEHYVVPNEDGSYSIYSKEGYMGMASQYDEVIRHLPIYNDADI